MTQHPLSRRYNRLAVGANRKAARLGRLGRISAQDLAVIFLASEGVCHYCGIDIEPGDCSFDHVVAFDKGGENTRANIVACCLTCNRGKFTKDETEFAAWRELSVTCPIDGVVFRPRWADHVRGLGRYCSRRCSGAAGGSA